MHTFLGIELGSTRIKSVLINQQHEVVAQGSHIWENTLQNGMWTYSLDAIWAGVQESYRNLAQNFEEKHGHAITAISGIGISAMMHGYLPFDAAGKLLVPFRTWRNTTTEKAAAVLTREFNFNIPQRWSIAHLYQAMLNQEQHVGEIDFITTLAGYVHWQLTGEKVAGVGDASGIFPIDASGGYDATMVKKFDKLAAGSGITLGRILPVVKMAGQAAGALTENGAKLLDPSGKLAAGIPFCPPEGDAGTGMVATNSVAVRTGNISAGTSVFAMIVLEEALQKLHVEIDMVTTPHGKPVAMVHCNNCSSDIDAWVSIFSETLEAFGHTASRDELYATLYSKALGGDANAGGVLSYNYYAGEPITAVAEGRPMLVRKPDANFNLQNLMRSLLYSAIATLKIGMVILEGENVHVDKLLGHGGFFKTQGVGQQFMAAALGVPVSVFEHAGEGGAWGIAVLAAYAGTSSTSLEAYLDGIFATQRVQVATPLENDRKGFDEYLEAYKRGFLMQRAAIKTY